jgi:adenylosuccinate lyase
VEGLGIEWNPYTT